MADVNIWARGQWDLMLLVAFLADDAQKHNNTSSHKLSATYKLGVSFFALQTQCLACEPCRKYYSHHFIGFHEARKGNQTLSLVNFTHTMNRFVQAKISGGSGQPLCNNTNGNVLQLRRRYDALGGGVLLSNEQIIMVFILQVLQARQRTLCDPPDARHVTNFRLGCIYHSFHIVLALLANTRSSFVEMVRPLVDEHTPHDDPVETSVDAMLSMFVAIYNALPDTHVMTPEAMIEKHVSTFQTAVSWMNHMS